MKAQLPAQIIIAGQRFRVTTRPKGVDLYGDSGEEIAYTAAGACNVDMGHIVVRDESGQSRDQIRDTLLHEVLHACVRLCSLTQPGRELDEAQVEEHVVDSLSTILLDTLRRNPALMAYLISEE